MKQRRALLVGLVCSVAFLLIAASPNNVTIVQLSDTHLGVAQAPNAADNLRKAVEMINARHPDAVILSGDIGENTQERAQVKAILKALKAPVYYVPGNHDIHNIKTLESYRKQFGQDYYSFHIKYVKVLALDSGLMGNYAFGPHTLPPMPSEMKAESRKMFAWLADQAASNTSQVVIAVQHIPLFRDNGFPDPTKAYWIVNDPYAKQEVDLLHKLGVKHLLAGHWHIGRVFEHDGITVHVAPATSWLPLGGQLGFAMHTITPAGDVSTEFVPLPSAML